MHLVERQRRLTPFNDFSADMCVFEREQEGAGERQMVREGERERARAGERERARERDDDVSADT